MSIYVISEDRLLEHNSLFLTDSTGTWEIRYNPQVTNFKYVVTESAVKTLGSKFPFVRRNGNNCYRQFNIAGLISARVNESVVNINDSVKEGKAEYHQETNDTVASSYKDELAVERDYRNALVAFLYGGNPKVFSSFTEGEMIVRLMNVSLTPNAQLGRMLYSFSAEVVEIADFSAENLEKYGINLST